METILVQMAEPDWTEEALHLACAMGRTTGAAVVLLKLIPVQHYGWLGTPLGFEITPEEGERTWQYKSIAASYGVDLSFQPMQYVTLTGALVEAAEQQEAQVFFACVPDNALPFWHKYVVWDLRRQLERRGCTLYTLDHPAQAVILATELGAVRQHA